MQRSAPVVTPLARGCKPRAGRAAGTIQYVPLASSPSSPLSAQLRI